MRRILLQLALFLVFGGWCATADAAWDLTNVTPITKPSGLKDGMYVYFRGQCNASSSNMVLGADFSYSNSEVKGNHLFLLVDAGKSVNGKQMFYMQNYANKKWFSGTVEGWTIENMDESTPLAIAEASQFTYMEMKVPGNPESNSSYTVGKWQEAGGDESLADADLFPNSTKIAVWKWRPSQLNDADGDALVLASFADDFQMNDDLTGMRSIGNVWGSAFGYTECWFNEGKTALNAYYAYEAVYVDDPIGDLELLLQEYKDDALSYKCLEGTDPGCLIDYSVYTSYAAKYQEAADFTQGVDLDEAKAKVLYEELMAARKALLEAPRVELTEGLYYIVSASWLFEQQQQFIITGEDGAEDVVVGKKKAMYDRDGAVPAWNDLYKEVTGEDGKKQIVTKTDPVYIFRVTKSKTDPACWDIQNAGTGRFLNGGTAQSVSMPTTPQEVVTDIAPNNGAFGIRNKGTGSGAFYHCANHGNGAGTGSNLTTWSLTSASTWHFIPVKDQAMLDTLPAAMDQMVLDNRLKAEISSADASMKPGYLALITDTLQFSANATEPSEGKLANLIDGNTGTYYHSAWSVAGPDEDHYLQIRLPEAVNKVAVDWYKRTSNHANRPAKITVMGQKEGSEDWTQAAILPADGDTLPWGSATPEYIKEIALNGGPYTALRFVVNETYTAAGEAGPSYDKEKGHPYFTFSEFQLYNGLNEDGSFQYRASSLAYREDVKPAYEALQKAVADARAVLGKTTEADIEALQAAIKAFDAAYPDTTILDYVIDKAETFYEQAIAADGDETLFGAYNTPELHEALNTVVEEAKAGYDKENVTRAYIDQHTAAIQKAIDDFVADVNKPKMDTWYFIKNMYQGDGRDENTNPYDQLIYPGGKNIGDGLKWGGDTYTGTNDATYLWRFIDLGNNTFAVQNFGTGYYMGANRGTSAQYLLSDTAVAFKFAYVAGMELTLEDANYNADVKDLRYIHADASHNVVTWSAAQASPSSWTFVEATDEADPYLLGTAGGMNIITLPFDVATTGELTDVLSGSEIGVYTLANAVLDEEGKVAQLTLNPMEIPVGGIKAGTPFIVSFPEEADENGNGVIGLNVDLEAPLSVEATTVNGVVGLLDKDTIKVDGMGYFVGDTQELTAAKKNTVINGQYGYINPKLITNVEAADGSIVIGIKNGGVLDNIQEAIKDANALVDVVDMSGVVVRRNVKKANALKGLAKGVYIVGGQKVSVK